MKTQLEKDDIKAIVDEVLEGINRMLAENTGHIEDELLTPDEVATLLKVKKPQIYAWVNESKYTEEGIPFNKAGKFLRFSKKEVLEWTEKHGKGIDKG